MVICLKKQKQCLSQEREAGDCWIGRSLANTSGLIGTRVGKHTDTLIEQLVCLPKEKQTPSNSIVMTGEAVVRVLPPEIKYHIGCGKTQ